MSDTQSSDETVTGSCLCKAVTYKATGTPMIKTICHCYNCRKASGGPMQGSSVYLKQQVAITGDSALKTYSDPATDSATPFNRLFCTGCGSQMFGWSPLAERMMGQQILAVNTGTLDREFVNAWTPTNEQYCETKGCWVPRLVGEEGMGRFKRSMMGDKAE
ncbi:hypothetical protein CAC42_1219 [Sphaceloma murrayae]|uniref:CENP-V/GFA domain-containing protein n=1 Tax=Sphaceloma murrayae TaxID=2082308 RepID=A0A2K1R2D7_9PEZI|nr:hypothetical protein CAC42_1219 [Sphaceloma murrayae]